MDKLKTSIEELENVKKIPNETYDLVTVIVPTNSTKAFELFTEAYRILRFGGVIEILTPDPSYGWILFALAEAKFQAMANINYSLNEEVNFKDLFGMGAFKLDDSNYQFINYKELIADTTTWCANLPKDFECVIGIPRSGMLVATVIASWLNVPLGTITNSNELIILSGGSKCAPKDNIKGKILIVDDSINWGKTLNSYKKLFKSKNLKAYYGALYYIKQSRQFIDYGFKEVNQLRVFEWNLFHHPLLGVSCVDIDGVLSEDPSAEENDDGPKYLKFLKGVKPKYIPTTKIHTLVTCRLEKYREVTEAWLKEHNIKYRKLIMMDYPTREARMKDNKYAIYKADIYRKTPDTYLFIESEEWQAEAIAKETGKRTLCIRSMKQFGI